MSIWLKIDVQGRDRIHHILWKLVGFISSYYKSKGKDFFITSIAEGLHQDGSFHYIYRAIDFKRNGISKEELKIIIAEFCLKYPKYKERDFDLLEYTDIRSIFHLELDIK